MANPNVKEGARTPRIRGRTWVLRDGSGRAIDDIDTDQIFHNAHLHITDPAEMGRHALGNLSGWEDFPEMARPGDVIVAGRNFGAGSSRQQAVDCFISLGISLIVAESFAPIYLRNAVNSGLGVLACPGIMGNGPDGRPLVETGDEIEADLVTGELRNLSRATDLPPGRPPGRVQVEIYMAGGLLRYGNKQPPRKPVAEHPSHRPSQA